MGGDLYTRLVRELRDLENKFEAAPKVAMSAGKGVEKKMAAS